MKLSISQFKRPGGNTQNIRQEQADMQDAERDAGSGSSVHTNDGLPFEEQDSEQGGEQSSLSNLPTSTAGSEAG